MNVKLDALGIGEDIVERLKNKTALAVAAGKGTMLVARELYRLRRGEISADEFRVRTGGHFGSSAGIVLGAATGAAFGAVVPGIGNIAGAFTGGVIGSMAGEEAGRWIASRVGPRVEKTPEPPASAETSAPPTPGEER